MFRSLEQERADYAWDCITEIERKQKEHKEKYESYVKKTPALILTSGLGNTLAFFNSKEDEAYKDLYRHLNDWAKKRLNKEDTWDILRDWIRDENTSSIDVFYLTREILNVLNWMKRFAEARLK